jgi:membrane protein required for colicin V production
VTLLDVGLLLVWLGVALSGFWKGAVRIVFGAGGAIAGIWLAVVAGADVEAWLDQLVPIDWVAAIGGRVLPIFACLGLFGLSGWGIDRTLRALHLSWVNRTMGALLAAVVGAILLGAFLVIAAEFSPTFAGLCERSLIAPVLVDLSEALFGSSP